MLDAGCGSGAQAQWLLDQGADAVAVDIRRTPHQRGGYFDTELVSGTWRKADVEVTQQFWRRPLAAVLGAFADAGFKVDRVAEPQPSAEALRLFPDDLSTLVGVPSFIVYRLWLQP